jgi:hypothetical protein
MKITSYDRPSSVHSVPYAIYQLAQAQIQIPDRRYPDLHFYHAIYPMSTFPSAPQPIRSPFTSSGTSINSELGALPSSPSLLSENSLSYATPLQRPAAVSTQRQYKDPWRPHCKALRDSLVAGSGVITPD